MSAEGTCHSESIRGISFLGLNYQELPSKRSFASAQDDRGLSSSGLTRGFRRLSSSGLTLGLCVWSLVREGLTLALGGQLFLTGFTNISLFFALGLVKILKSGQSSTQNLPFLLIRKQKPPFY